jgi:Tol biopolymer transport system component
MGQVRWHSSVGRLVVIAVFALICETMGAMPAGAAFPGPNGRIAFVNKNDGYQIFTMAPDGTDVLQLTSLKAAGAFGPSWSPDGSTILFTKGSHGKALASVWVMGADGTQKSELVGDQKFNYDQASYSPDGSSIVFQRCKRRYSACDLGTADAGGGNVQRLTPFDRGVVDASPQFSPDGTQVTLSRFDFNGSNAHIATYVMAADGSQIQRVTPFRLEAASPDWAPDGSKLVVDTHCCDGKKESIYQVNPDGSGLLKLTPTSPLNFMNPSFAPAGDAIVFERASADFSRNGIWVMAADGSGATRVAKRGFGPAWGSAP